MSQSPRRPDQADRDRARALALVEQLQPALQREDRATIVDSVRQLIELRAPMGGQWLALAQIMTDNGEIGLARRAIDLYVDSSAGNPAALSQKAAMLAHIGAWEEAAAVLDTLPPGQPDAATHAHMLGVAALHRGKTEQAREQLDRATQLRPQSGAAWHSLATLVDFAREPELADRLVAAEIAAENGAPDDRAQYYYALGKAHADRGEPARAFAAVARGASLVRSAFGYDRERDSLIATNAVLGYDAERMAAFAREQTEPTGRSIFVVGLPRSGTTLVQQILTSHSAVSGGGETTRLSLFAKDIRGIAYADLVKYVERVGAPSTARLWRHWMDELFPGPGRVVDKTTNTSRLLGVAAALLPDAPLIWLKRDPLDCAWSCFRTYFGPSQPWSYDLEDIAFHFGLEAQLLTQWRDILGDRLLVVPYEELVTEPGPWISRMLAHCGLPEEPQAFAPHENRRPVSTASMMQVRRPINRAGVGAAEPYREFLAPFIAAYRD